jgi:tripeptide aminopeptidase
MPSPLPWRDAALPPIAERFCRYAEVWTTSDPTSDAFPSTERQKDLGGLLVEELSALGLDAEMDEHGYVFATLPSPLPPAEADALPVVALVAHVDTSPDAPGENVRPHVHPAYDGGPVTFPGAPDLRLDADGQPALARHVGHDLITSDGTTLLGSDDKAGVAAIVQLAADLVRADAEAAEIGDPPPPRPTLRLLFTPDEEIGKGTDKLDLARLGADVAYTLDGSGTDTLNVETFHAAEAVLRIEGVGVHPGYAKGVMVNAVRIAAAFVEALAGDPAPETTEGREGYLHPHTVEATTEGATVKVLLRDHDAAAMDAKRDRVRQLAAETAGRFPGATVDLTISESYRNMRSYIESVDPRAISVAVEAARAMGVEPALEPIRGGTDGARLSEKGLPCPNVFTGGYDFHSRFEWNTVQNLERTLAYAHALVREWGVQSGTKADGATA